MRFLYRQRPGGIPLPREVSKGFYFNQGGKDMDQFTVRTNGGEKIYIDKAGEEIGTYKEGLTDIVAVSLSPLKDFLEMLPEDGAAQSVMFIAQALLERAENKIYDAIDFIKENHGEALLIKARCHQNIKSETNMDIEFTPAKA